MTSSEPSTQEHILHLENDFDGVKGVCPCGYCFTGVDCPTELIRLISEHCAPIGGEPVAS